MKRRKSWYRWILSGLLLSPIVAYATLQNQATNGHVVGRFLDEAGEGVEGVFIRIHKNTIEAESLFNLPETQTNKNGEFEFANLPDGQYRIVAANASLDFMRFEPRQSKNFIDAKRHAFRGSEEHPHLVQTVEVKDAKQQKEVIFRLVKAALITGTVFYDGDKRPASGVKVSPDGDHGTTSTTNENGEFFMKGLHPGDGTIDLKTIWYSRDPRNEWMQGCGRKIEGIKVKSGEDANIDIKVFRIDPTMTSLEGSVSVDGIPYTKEQTAALKEKGFMYGDIFVSVKNVTEGIEYETITSRKSGVYRLCSVKPGKYILKCRYYWGKSDPAQKRGPIEGTTDVEVKTGEVLKINVEFLTTPEDRVTFKRP